MAIPIFEVLERAREGERVEEKTFDMRIFRTAERLRKEYSLKYDPGNPVPTDDVMADRVYQAGVQLYEEVGTYCVDTGRVLRFTRSEIEEALAEAPSELVLGAGSDKARLVHLSCDGTQEPGIFGGIQTAVFSSEAMASRIISECARDKCIDGVWGGVVTRVDDTYDMVAGTPAEIYGYRKNIELMRKAVAAAGRPGMVVVNNGPRSIATIAMVDEERGLRRTDGMPTSGVSELKVNYDDLDRVIYALAAGLPIHGAHISIMGGFSGSLEGAAIVAVSGALQVLLVNHADLVGLGTVPFQLKSRGTREGLWVGSIAVQAVARNTHLVLSGANGDHPAAGPGTKQYLYEAAAGFISNTVSGGHQWGGTRKFVIGRTPDYGTPLESRWMGQVCKSAAGMTRAKANEICKYLLSKYEDKLKDPPAGWTYHELWDMEKGRPKPEYERLYREVLEEFAGLGFNIRQWEGAW
ncbi:MAG: monomethylamine:corrinoid methyltransferase [Chloroflexi bacterium]|nr:monomethylamine:corrinoid methyltransferase [Chloroflexota bacterium]